jgi:hypothetical protein
MWQATGLDVTVAARANFWPVSGFNATGRQIARSLSSSNAQEYHPL